MNLPIPEFIRHAITSAFTSLPRPGLQPIPGTKPVTLEALICPPLVYYLALLFLAPPPPGTSPSRGIAILRNILALLASYLFFRLPLAYHIPQSIGLTYQLGLVGLYGGLRVLDACFITFYLFGHVPRRVTYTHLDRIATPQPTSDSSSAALHPWSDGGDTGHLRRPSNPRPQSLLRSSPSSNAHTPKPLSSSPPSSSSSPPIRPSLKSRLSSSTQLENMTNESFSSLASSFFLHGPAPTPVLEHASTESGFPQNFLDRAAWAFELMLSMRGTGFTWTTADVRHTRKTWLPTVGNRVHSLVLHVGPVLMVCWGIIRGVYVGYIRGREREVESPFDELVPGYLQFVLVTALGGFLMGAFSMAHSLAAILAAGLAGEGPLAFFPALYTARVWEVTSLRMFWSHGWHRLFARLFLVWGTWPGEWIERKILGKGEDEPAEVGKIMGAFVSSACVHSFAVRGTLGGSWRWASGEACFFLLNGVGIIAEEGVRRLVRSRREKLGREAVQWYDAYVGRIYWIAVLLCTGRFFARGWTKAGLVREMAFL